MALGGGRSQLCSRGSPLRLGPAPGSLSVTPLLQAFLPAGWSCNGLATMADQVRLTHAPCFSFLMQLLPTQTL